MTVLGVDVSVWQGKMDWRKTVRAGAWFAFVKASQGLRTDPRFVENWRASRGVLLHGAYHFYQPGVNPETQAEAFYHTVEGTGDLGELPPVLDVEREPVSGKVPSWAEVLAFLEKTWGFFGRKPLVYTSPGMAQAITAEHGQPPEELGRYGLWVAHYGVDKPSVPEPWLGWRFWQYSDQGDGHAFGAESGHIDLNRWNGDLAGLLGFAFQNDAWAASAWLWQALRAVDAVADEPVDGERYLVTVARLRVRRGPGLRYPVVGYLAHGDEVVVTEKRRADGYTWGRIGTARWVALEFCERG